MGIKHRADGGFGKFSASLLSSSQADKFGASKSPTFHILSVTIHLK